MDDLIEEAGKVFNENFPNETWFERALFFSWSCSIRDCTFCYMSTQEKKNQSENDKAVRSKESLYAEAIICKNLGWKIGFFSGGINAYHHDDILEMIKVINDIIGDKVWINIGPTPNSYLEKYKPYIKGVVASIETTNPKLHKDVCPSKPIGPYVRMFDNARELGLKCAMTLILGLGETKKDFETLKDFISKNNIKKIHVYALNPVKGTVFEGKSSPNKDYHAWYIANLRIAFPKIDIQMGIWKDKIDRVSLLLDAGANSISKFPIIKEFGKKSAADIESEVSKAGRKFLGSLTAMPETDWNLEVDRLKLDEAMKKKVKKKLELYLKKMASNSAST